MLIAGALLAVLAILVAVPAGSPRNVEAGPPTPVPFTFVVNDPSDGTPPQICTTQCRLRDAIFSANQRDGADLIRFSLNVSELVPLTEMLYIDASDGIDIDGAGGAGGFINMDCPPGTCMIDFGWVFITDEGVPAKNIKIANLSASRFHYDGFQICAGLDTDVQDCLADVSDVTLSDLGSGINLVSGFRILGNNITNVSVGNGLSFNGNLGNGLLIQAHGLLKNVIIDNTVTMPGNGVSGVRLIGEGGIDGVTITGGRYYSSGSHGLYVHGTGTTANISVSGLRVDGNTGSGMELSSNGGSMFGITVSGLQADNNGLYGIDVNSSAGLGGSITGSTATGNTGTGLHARGAQGMSGLSITGNTVNDNDDGIYVETGGIAQGLVIEDNDIYDGDGDGLTLTAGSGSGNNNMIRGNTIAGNGGAGIVLLNSVRATISQNFTYVNERLGIDLVAPGDPADGVTPNDAGDGDTGPNGLLNFPVLSTVDASHVTGTACAGCLVEVFANDGDPSNHGEGLGFLGEGTADPQGNFSITICTSGTISPLIASATAREADGSTSEFAANLFFNGSPQPCPSTTPSPSPTPTPTPTAAPTPTPTPSSTPTPSPTPGPATPSPSPTPTLAPGEHTQGDLDCDGDIDAVDALIAILEKFGLTLPAGDNGSCPIAGSGDPPFGDVNCDDAVDGLDALAILAHLAKTPLPRPITCIAIGATLP